jgi:hypothetical protein
LRHGSYAPCYDNNDDAAAVEAVSFRPIRHELQLVHLYIRNIISTGDQGILVFAFCNMNKSREHGRQHEDFFSQKNFSIVQLDQTSSYLSLLMGLT